MKFLAVFHMIPTSTEYLFAVQNLLFERVFKNIGRCEVMQRKIRVECRMNFKLIGLKNAFQLKRVFCEARERRFIGFTLLRGEDICADRCFFG